MPGRLRLMPAGRVRRGQMFLWSRIHRDSLCRVREARRASLWMAIPSRHLPICRSADADCVSARSGVGNAGLRLVTAAATAAEAAADAAAYPLCSGEGVVLTPCCRLAAMPRRWVALCSLITCSCDYERCIFTYSIKQFNVCHCCRNAHACCESLHLVYALVLQVYSFVLPAFIRYRPRVDLK